MNDMLAQQENRYLAAKRVAPLVHQAFELHRQEALSLGNPAIADTPSIDFIETIVDTAFWASLRREEGHTTKISLAYLPPHQALSPLLFQHPFTLTPQILTKLSPGVERAGIYLGLWPDKEGNPVIWGTTLQIPPLCFVVDVSEPGLLVIKHRRSNGIAKFTNIAVLNGDQVKIVHTPTTDLSKCPNRLRTLIGFISGADQSGLLVNPLIQLAVSMRAHKHGGTLLIVPSDTETWTKSILHPLKYGVNPSYTGLADVFTKQAELISSNTWQTAFRNELEHIAGLTAIDGATLLNDRYELLAFGCKIGRAEGNERVETVYQHEPIYGSEPSVVNPAQTGGTRHLSAAQFVFDQRDALALVASQDGHFTVFAWLESKNMVQAYRIDSLLL